MKTTAPKKPPKEYTEDLLLTQLQAAQQPISLEELQDRLQNADCLNISHRLIMEAAWKLVEEGKAQFTASWNLKLR
jgi:hypothetical protein